MTLVCVFDVETTDLVLQNRPPDDPRQPRLVQLAVALYTDSGVEVACSKMIVKPDGWTIPAASTKVHGITTDFANAVGLPLVCAAATFSQFSKVADVHVAHNAAFDVKMMQVVFHSLGRQIPLIRPTCTKEMADPVLRLPPTDRMVAAGFGSKFKSPSLSECVRFLFGEEIDGAHDALVDVYACARVYFELKRREKDGRTAEG